MLLSKLENKSIYEGEILVIEGTPIKGIVKENGSILYLGVECHSFDKWKEVAQYEDILSWNNVIVERTQSSMGPKLSTTEIELIETSLASAFQVERIEDLREDFKSLKKSPKKNEVTSLPPHQTFPSQERIAAQLLKKISSVPSFQQKQSLPIKVLYIVPPRITLLEQTRLRIDSFQEFLGKSLGGRISFDLLMSSKGKEMKETFQRFKSGEESLRVIIHDECHWGVGAGGVVDEWINDPDLMNDPNSILIQVSATAWNQLAVVGTRENASNKIVSWNEETANANDTKYYGRELLIQHGHISEDTTVEYLSQLVLPFLQRINPKISSKLANEENATYRNALLCVLRYCFSLQDLLGTLEERGKPFVCPETVQFLSKVLKEEKMCVIRMPKSFKGSALTSYFLLFLQEILKKKKKEHLAAVMQINSKEEVEVSSFWFQKIAKAQKRKTPLFQTMEDLKDIPAIVIVTEKFRMGDTFPSHFSCFDLRTRYTSSPLQSFSALLQDVGRAFSWDSDVSNRPHVLLSSVAKEVLEDPRKALHEGTLKSIDPAMKEKRSPQADDSGDEAKPVEQFDALFLTESFLKSVPHEKKHFYEKRKELLQSSGALDRRFVLSAEPQIGKTGAILHFLFLLLKHLDDRTPVLTPEEEEKLKTEFQKLNDNWYESSSKDLQERLKKDKGEWENYHHLYRIARKKWTLIPAHEAVKSIEAYFAGKQIVVADFGCGEDLLLLKKLQEKNLLHHYYGIDHVVTTSLQEENVKLIEGNMETMVLKNKSIDVAVFCLSWMGQSILNYLTVAKKCLKMGGYLIVWETTNSLRLRKDKEDSMKKNDLQNFLSHLLVAKGMKLIKMRERGIFTEIIARRTDNPFENV